ncbi:GNAT family N-acetyltransferase [Hyunsoonleella flava]|uniref:GNAT family N-acetyltransferase n=1 Tax=Hyunsoonleella flava TaxID=2527939 RepID=A0A4Q9FJM6_9FLAO|nr:GNAT family N-acetyltransferase [Hyunsoonleella flava]TBN06504.1 GNAT family N-acetyltransferase [Hyunsoonleella flava]
MELKNDPFSNTIFQQLWIKHFSSSKDIEKFKFIDGINFYRGFLNSLYFNVGRNLTKGNTYKLIDSDGYKKKALVIYDVLPHLQKNNNEIPKNLEILKSVQYPGFLINLKKFKNIDDYLLHTFSKNTRAKMRRFSRRLDECFDLTTKMYFGDIDKTEYEFIFKKFLLLLQKRFADKGIYNNNIQQSEWNFYKEVAYPLIQDKKASLFVIYNKNEPIAIKFIYHSTNIAIDAITVFDIDYSKFNLGYVNNLKFVSWCFDNDISILDFSKGYFDYKKRMCTLQYDFEYHILFDKKSIRAKSIAYAYYYMFEVKAYLRRKKINTIFHKIFYQLKKNNVPEIKINFEILKLDTLPDNNDIVQIDIHKNEKFTLMKKHVYDFQYLAVKPYQQIKVYKHLKKEYTYILWADSLIQQIVLK